MAFCRVAVRVEVATASGQNIIEASEKIDVMLILVVLLVIVDFQHSVGPPRPSNGCSTWKPCGNGGNALLVATISATISSYWNAV